MRISPIRSAETPSLSSVVSGSSIISCISLFKTTRSITSAARVGARTLSSLSSLSYFLTSSTRLKILTLPAHWFAGSLDQK